MRATVQLLVGIALLGGCGAEQISTETLHLQPPAVSSRESVAAESEGHDALHEDLATLRRVTAPFHSFKNAVAAGWSAEITPCMADPDGAGGMGFHYGNTALIDGTVRVDAPQLLLYEPDREGRFRLVAVEYIIPYTARSRSATPPVLFGQEFKQNDTFQLWGLHVWVWKDNPSGLFANWNPRVSCAHTKAISPMSH
jgi:hypothetical protein